MKAGRTTSSLPKGRRDGGLQSRLGGRSGNGQGVGERPRCDPVKPRSDQSARSTTAASLEKKAYLPLVLARGPVDRESAQRPSRQPTGRPFGGGAARDVLLLRDGPKLSHVMMRAAWVSDRCRLCPWRRDGWLERSVERGRWQGLGADDERAQEDHREEDGDYPGEEEVWVEHALVESLCPPGHPELRAKEYMCRGRVLRVAVGGRSGTPKRQKKADPSPAPPNHNSTFGSSS